MTTTTTPKNDLTKSEVGLAEWASKIKAMQRQVDEDEEAEQRKLQEEIAASRLKRLRRSQMYGRSATPDIEADSSRAAPDESTEDLSSSGDRSTAQADALRQLTGAPQRTSPAYPTSPPSSAKEPVSLAAFIGGRAAGPRLNKHPTQQDAHDPTQFEQRKNAANPHPVFGRGGVAMPGMAKNAKTAATVSQVAVESSPESAPRSFPSRASTTHTPSVNSSPATTSEPLRSFPARPTYERQPSTPSLAKRYIEQIQDKPIVAHQTGFAAHRARSKSRERTISTPAGSFPMRSTAPIATKTPPASRPVSAEYTMAKSVSESPTTPSRPSPIGSAAATPVPSPSSNGRFSSNRHSTPPAQRLSTPSASPSLHTPSLARQVLPTPKPTPFGPQVPQAPVISPAFLRAPATKQPTPSLSRLKGRGFVQSMVGRSSELQAGVDQTSPGGTPEKSSRPLKRLSNVLERWPQGSDTPSPPPSPKLAEQQEPRKPVAKALPQVHVRDFGKVANVAASAGVPIKLVQSPAPTPKPASEARVPKKKKSLTKLPPAEQEDQTAPKKKNLAQASPAEDVDIADAAKKQRGIGSSNTLISYIKPMKTGDEPQTDVPPRAKTPTSKPPARPKTPQGDLDELGLRKKRSSGALRGRVSFAVTPAPAAAVPLPSGTPLSHPTKRRAKKPRKGDKPKTSEPLDTSAPSTDVKPKQDVEETEQLVSRVGPLVDVPPSTITSTSSSVATPVRDEPRSPPTNAHKPSAISFPVILPSVDEITPENTTRPTRPSKVTDRWAPDMPVIGVKPSQPRKASDGLGSGRPSGEPNSMIRRALPGMAPSPVGTPSPVPVMPVQDKPSSHDRAPSTPRQRVPSTGSRARVMDVAEAFKEHERRSSFRDSPASAAPEPVKEEALPAPPTEPIVHITPPATLHASHPPAEEMPAPHSPVMVSPRLDSPNAEKRKSSYNDKYAAVALPPLKEETPVSSPAGTLARSARPHEEQVPVKEPPVLQETQAVHASSVAEKLSVKEEVQLALEDIGDLPVVDVNKMLKSVVPLFKPAPDTRVVSVDVMTISGSSATELKTDVNVFYDMDVLAVIERLKSITSGLVATSVWAWFGKNSKYGENEEQKLQELAKRYGTTLLRVQQNHEPQELLHALGKQLAVRQGARAHWSSENTAMHVVRSIRGDIFIDEHDLNIINLCSAFSYCLSILDTLYVWHGCGSTTAEREAALAYAQKIGDEASVVELFEGKNDDDEMFWMILGSDDYAKANYWHWRASSIRSDPRIWTVDAKGKPLFEHQLSLPDTAAFNTAVHILDCHWELYVVVGQHARPNRRSIALAVKLAKEFSRRAALSLPFAPAVHIVVLPSQLPLDLRMSLRGLEENRLNDDDLPDHMNVLHHSTATYHLQKRAWPRAVLEDSRMLPLGVHPSLLP